MAIVQRERFSLDAIVNICSDVCEALTYLHANDVMNCFVSTLSIMLLTPTIAKLGNFEHSTKRSVISVGVAPWLPLRTAIGCIRYSEQCVVSAEQSMCGVSVIRSDCCRGWQAHVVSG